MFTITPARDSLAIPKARIIVNEALNNPSTKRIQDTLLAKKRPIRPPDNYSSIYKVNRRPGCCALWSRKLEKIICSRRHRGIGPSNGVDFQLGLFPFLSQFGKFSGFVFAQSAEGHLRFDFIDRGNAFPRRIAANDTRLDYGEAIYGIR